MPDEEQKVVVQGTPVPKKSCGWMAAWVVLFLILFGVFGILGFTKWMQLTQQLRELKDTVKNTAKLEAEKWSPVDEKMNQLNTAQTALQTELQQQGATLASWKEAASGNIDRWYVAEARYLVKLAQFEVTLSRNYALVNGYLEKAQDVLQKVSDPKVVDMRSTLKQDQDDVLKASSAGDLTAHFEKLVALDKQIDKLPLPLQKLEPVAAPVAANISATNQAWWTQGLEKSWQLLKEIVVVRKNASDRAPFILPDEKILLQANLHLQMQHALDGLLRNQAQIYTTSLQQAIEWVTLYFKADDPFTAAWLKEVIALQQVDLSRLQLDVSHTLPLFDAYLNQ